MNVLIVGRGRVGRGLHASLVDVLDARLRSGRGRIPKRELREADVLLLAVPDSAIRETAVRLASHTSDACVLLHCAGSLGPSVFGDLNRTVGVLHPLVSFADPRRPPSLEGTTFALAGPVRARKVGRDIAEACGAYTLEAGEEGVLGSAYHASAALVANGAAALATVGVGVLHRLGVKPRAAQRAVGALLRSVADNVERIGVPQSLTGPIMRGDADTVARHRGALHAVERKAYDALGPTILEVAVRLGLSKARARALGRQWRKTK